MEMENFERAEFLPNPNIKREFCVPECMGCNKMYSNIPFGKCVLEDHVCIAYASPKEMHRNGGCVLKSNRILTAEEIKKMNPLKASKRARRRG